MPEPGRRAEDLLHQFQQLIDARIGDAIFDGREQAELPAEAEDIPGIDDRAAFDAAVQQVVDLLDASESLDEPPSLRGSMRRRDKALNLANDPSGNGRHDLHLFRKPAVSDVLAEQPS
jgi:hypothetical protein